MSEDKYEIWCGTAMLADDVAFDIAIILVKALFQEWYGQSGVELKIRRKQNIDCGPTMDCEEE